MRQLSGRGARDVLGKHLPESGLMTQAEFETKTDSFIQAVRCCSPILTVSSRNQTHSNKSLNPLNFKFLRSTGIRAMPINLEYHISPLIHSFLHYILSSNCLEWPRLIPPSMSLPSCRRHPPRQDKERRERPCAMLVVRGCQMERG